VAINAFDRFLLLRLPTVFQVSVDTLLGFSAGAVSQN
jgi:hypothetical protein